MTPTKYIRQNIYRWHRITSLIVAVPLLLWTVSGFMHPVMNSFKPRVRNTALPSVVLDSNRISMPLAEALKYNNIPAIQNFRIVKLYEVFYYQVQQEHSDTLTYINCTTGTILLKGDNAYAAYLAKRYLQEPIAQSKKEHHGHHVEASLAVALKGDYSVHEKAKVKSVRLITQFDDEYKASNKILPVYKVEFDRGDHIRLYIEPVADRLVVAVDSRKAWFTRFFALTHTWSFLNSYGKLKTLLLGSFSALCFFTSVFGFYIYNISKKRKVRKSNFAQNNINWHRIAGNVFLTTTLLFAASGAWHSFHKLPAKEKKSRSYTSYSFGADELGGFNLKDLPGKQEGSEHLSNISVVQMQGRKYWQLTYSIDGKSSKQYLDMRDGTLLPQGDQAYARYLACKFSGRKEQDIFQINQLTSFNHAYSMMNKRLPVAGVSFKGGDAYYIETSTGQLAATVKSSDKLERFSFSNLHMHHYWEMWLGHERGSSARNLVLMLSTLGLLSVALSGILIYVKRKLQKR